jgi:serine/threonine protein kinase
MIITALPPGSRVGSYEVVKVLTWGPTGETYEALGPLGNLVGVRVLPPSVALSFSDARLRSAITLDHQGISRIFEVFEDNRRVVLVLERLYGESLADRLARGRLAIDALFTIAEEVLDALAYSHAHGVQHGGLNPTNIVLTSRGVKLTDFGIAAPLQRQLILNARDADPAAKDTDFAHLDPLRYLSPEQFAEQSIDTRSDSFAVGAILFEMATGAKAFQGHRLEDLMDAVTRRAPLFESMVQSAPDLVPLTRWCLEKESSRRAPSAADIARELRDLRVRSRSTDTGVARVQEPTEAAHPSWHLDENVQFTVYRPQTIAPGKWYSLLAFAHLSERRPDAARDEPDPVREVQKRAQELLREDAREYRSLTQDSGHAVPREGELTFVPSAKGIEFNPPRRSFLWQEPVHCESFRLRAQPSVDGRQVRGRFSIFLGSIILAELALTIRVDSAPEEAVRVEAAAMQSARAYRRIFASYSHKDVEIVEEFEKYAAATGDEYLRDAVALRSGQGWQDELYRLIDNADVFQLFWSKNSMGSEFVRREWEYALHLGRDHFVRPVYWQEPLPAAPGLPPDALRQLHFQRIAPRLHSGGAPASSVGDPTGGVMPWMVGGAQGGVAVEGLGSASGPRREVSISGPPQRGDEPSPAPLWSQPSSSGSSYGSVASRPASGEPPAGVGRLILGVVLLIALAGLFFLWTSR